VVSKPLSAVISITGESESNITQQDQSENAHWSLNYYGSATCSLCQVISDGAMTVSDGAIKLVSKPVSFITQSSGESESEISEVDQSNSAYWLLNQCGSATSSVCQVLSLGAMTVSDRALEMVSKPLSLVIPSSGGSDTDVSQLNHTCNPSSSPHHDSAFEDIFSRGLSTELDARNSSMVLHDDLNNIDACEEQDPDESQFGLGPRPRAVSRNASEQQLSSAGMSHGRPNDGSDLLIATIINSTAAAGIVALVIVS